jgi:DNA-binding IclR family transcriptional regulator
MRAVGAPICRTDTGEVLGALSFSAPTTRFSGPMYETDIPERVQSVAQVIGLKATYS